MESTVNERKRIYSAYMKYQNDEISKAEIRDMFGIESKITKGISAHIFDKLRELRSADTTFDIVDKKAFLLLDGSIHENIKKESTAFLEFMLAETKDSINTYNLEDKIHLAKTRDWRYYMTGYEKNIIDMHEAIKKELTVRNTDTSFENCEISKIENKLTYSTTKFKREFINFVISKAADIYDNYIKANKEIEESLIKLSEDCDYNYKEIQSLKRKRAKLLSVITNSKDNYINNIKESAERKFTWCIHNLSIKMFNHNIYSNFVITDINYDPRLLELRLTTMDGDIYYCRSIIAAENSDKVETHFRYIITKIN